MSAALYIVLEDDDPGFDAFVNGKALSGECDSLDSLASGIGVKPLMAFFSQNVEELEGFLEVELEASSELEIPQEQWFDATDGLKTVIAIMKQLESNPDGVRNAVSVTRDLVEFESVLGKAAANGVRWHLAVDY